MAGCLAGTCLGCTQAIFAGVRSPPLRGIGHRSRDGLAGKGRGMARKAVFSEGCAPRVRIARPNASPGYGMITEERTNGRWPSREMLLSSASLSRGRAEPAPPRRGRPQGGLPRGERPGDDAEGRFLGDTVLGCQASLV